MVGSQEYLMISEISELESNKLVDDEDIELIIWKYVAC